MQIKQEELMCYFAEKLKEDEKFNFECHIQEMEFKVARSLKQYRIALDMSQEEVAKKSGLTRQMVSRVETFSYTPNLTTLIKYLWALNIDFVEMIDNLESYKLHR